MTTNDTGFHEQQAEEMLEWYKNLSEEEQELFEEDLIGMLTAFTEYIKKEERISIAKQVIREIKGNLEKIQKNNSYFIRSFRTS